MSGWFSVKRGITTHSLFVGHPERLAIWIWLLDNVAWQDTKHDIGGKTVVIPRGSVAASERRMAEEIGVGRQVVRTFLARLQDEHMINPDLTHGRRIISLCNWLKYQTPPDQANPAPNPALTHDQPTKETREQYTLDTDVSNADPVKVMFDSGIALLTAAGKSPQAARSVLGKWRKDHGEAAVITALGKAKREGAIDPVSFCEGVFKYKPSGPAIGDRKTSNGRTVEYGGAVDGWMEVRQ